MFSEYIEKLLFRFSITFFVLIFVVLALTATGIIFRKKFNKIFTLLLMCVISAVFCIWLYVTTVFFVPIYTANKEVKNNNLSELSGVVTKIDEGKSVTYVYIDDEKYLFTTEMIRDFNVGMTLEIVYGTDSHFIVAYWITLTN